MAKQKRYWVIEYGVPSDDDDYRTERRSHPADGTSPLMLIMGGLESAIADGTYLRSVVRTTNAHLDKASVPLWTVCAYRSSGDAYVYILAAVPQDVADIVAMSLRKDLDIPAWIEPYAEAMENDWLEREAADQEHK